MMIEWIEYKLSGEKKTKYCVVIPIYKTPNELENKILAQGLKILGKWDICFVTPLDIEIGNNECNYRILHPNSEYFKSIDGYNLLLTEKKFYEAFSEYEYMLIYQLDCWVFRDELEEWCNKGYDYIGAPWLNGVNISHNGKTYSGKVGNGGFSLRKISSFIELLQNYDLEKIENGVVLCNEDAFFGVYNKDKLRIPEEEEAALFSLETFPEIYYSKTKTIPFGCHKWTHRGVEFWKDIIGFKITT